LATVAPHRPAAKPLLGRGHWPRADFALFVAFGLTTWLLFLDYADRRAADESKSR
jgi:hypothetical protein